VFGNTGHQKKLVTLRSASFLRNVHTLFQMSSFGNRKIDSECSDFFEEVLAESLGDECDGGSFGEATASEEEELLRIGCAHGGRMAAADIISFDFERRERRCFDV